jgi:hypothetical protein
MFHLSFIFIGGSIVVFIPVLGVFGFQGAGFLLAASGAILIMLGTLVNNLYGRHRLAMKLWGVGNPAMFFWAGGFIAHLWTADLGIYFIFTMYAVFWASGWYGLVKYRGRGLP